LKQLIAGIDREHQTIAACAGLLACSDINNKELMPELCHLLRRHFKLKYCGFFWSDEYVSLFGIKAPLISAVMAPLLSAKSGAQTGGKECVI
ncbi:MAG: hypothetical protein WA632_10955, partial [Gallionella sp.]